MSCSRRSSPCNSRSTSRSAWRSVSTTSIASMVSSSAGALAGTAGAGAGRGSPAAGTELAVLDGIRGQRRALPGEACQAALGVLHRTADLLAVLRGFAAHLVDDLA